jgi:hypothetical protein
MHLDHLDDEHRRRAFKERIHRAREHVMKMHDHRKAITTALGVAAAAVGAPAILFAGAGSAQAQTNVWTSSDALGVTAHVHSWGSPGTRSGGACT